MLLLLLTLVIGVVSLTNSRSRYQPSSSSVVFWTVAHYRRGFWNAPRGGCESAAQRALIKPWLVERSVLSAASSESLWSNRSRRHGQGCGRSVARCDEPRQSAVCSNRAGGGQCRRVTPSSAELSARAPRSTRTHARCAARQLRHRVDCALPACSSDSSYGAQLPEK